MKRTRRVLAICCVLIASSYSGAQPRAQDSSPELAGRWNGAIDAMGQVLEIRLRFEGADGAWRGSLSIPVQGLVDAPLSEIELVGPKLSFALPGVPGNARFEGEFDSAGTRLEGPFLQHGLRMRWHALSAAAAPSGLDGFGEWLEAARTAWDVPGIAIACVRGDQVALLEARGRRDVEQDLPVTPDTLFAIGSCTKAFTALALEMLVAEGRAEWDQPVRASLPAFRLHERIDSNAVTLRDLVTHRTGLPRHDMVWYGRPSLQRRAVLERLPHLEPTARLRERWQYNNLMYVVAGLVIEDLTGGTWEDALRARIVEPLGMTRTVFSVAEAEADPDHALPYELDKDRATRIPYRRIENVGPAGSIQSSVRDMARWVGLWLGKGRFAGREVAAERSLEALRTPAMLVPGPDADAQIVSLGYAHGWTVHRYRGHVRVSHGGGIDGFSAMVSFVPDAEIGVVVLSNVTGSLPEIVTRQALDRLLDLEPRDWSGEALAKKRAAESLEPKEADAMPRRMDAPPPRELAEYVGDYEHPGYGRIEVRVEDAGLRLTADEISARLEPWHFEVFRFVKEPKTVLGRGAVQFVSNFEGEIEALRVRVEAELAPVSFVRLADARLADASYLARYVGSYTLSGAVARVALRGTRLELSVPGQPTYRLKGLRPDLFELEALSGFRVRFEVEGDGPARVATFLQPNGVFRAERVPE